MEKGKSIVCSQRNLNDLSKIRILLCDINVESCQEISSLLCQCSYQVSAVWSAREIFDTLDSEGPRAHIILVEVNLLMANDARVLRHIVREKQLQRTPVIILATPDEVSVTVKGLRLGAADYLMKPLQGDELSSLWMHLE
ncbi:two-component response regulator-like aprr1 [Phtheirospermum japonicum]|uniref:Two-component response regulator-like aprr1 n=1 Tax=Phtheirospermum japonicum TaxID=374723 RepID=A0A830C4R9_9LAMI|nr:two-component response regulator-like aprr1 [Phtheirospermum japonicum]